MARFWIADLHLGHVKVARLRGFDSVEEHDRVIVDQLSALKAGDEVWVLGDISSGRPEGEDNALATLQNITHFEGVRFHLIAGNHDSVSSIHRQGYKKQFAWMEVFDSIQQFGRLKLAGKQVLMSHYPYSRSGDGPERDSSRYHEFRLPDQGFPLIHGHTHQKTPHMTNVINQKLRDGTFRVVRESLDTKQFCVSWDSHRRLVTEADLNKWLGEL